ncbi:MAG: ATP-grasp domain-containing protein [Lentisphaerales bacterium]|nr:ATP-grasp domain-containing protein [Lentisphaerales bacterium]
MNILFLNAGRRCELIKAFKSVLSKFPGGGLVFGSDITPLAPALKLVDKKVIFPHSSSDDFKANFIAFCLEYEVDLVIPTIDPDLIILDRLRDELAVQMPSTRLLLPNSEVVRVGADKVMTKQTLGALGVRVPKTLDPSLDSFAFPVFVKPACGSAGENARKICNQEELVGHLEVTENPIVEEFIDGPEFTVDVFCNRHGQALLAIPRKRLSVRGGEVAKGVVERNEELEGIACSIAQKLNCDSPITIQFIKQDDEYVAIEINARLGGGLPLSVAAGANWPLWILDLARGREPEVKADIKDRLIMSRYDQSIFFDMNTFEKSKPNLSGVKVLILDMDDTLYPEREFVYSGYRKVAKFCLEEFGIYVEDELCRRFDAGERGDLFSTVLKSAGINLPEHEVLKMVKLYRTHEPKIHSYADVEILKKLHAEGYTLCLISDGWQEVQQKKWQALGLDEFFTHKIFTDSLGESFWKPHPRSFELMVQWMGIDFSEAVYIADNPAKDFIAPNQLGMHSLRIKRYGSVHGNEYYTGPETEPEFEISSLTELKSMLKNES